MHYLGGKERISKSLAFEINQYINDENVLEPFCGGLSMTSRIKGHIIASDVSKPLITLYKSLQNGWEPPDYVSEEDYHHYKKLQDENDPMTAFVGFGCSFSGKYFGGYARCSDNKNYALSAKKSLKRKINNCKNVKFECKSYKDYNPTNMVIYCDPPYVNTTKYKGINDFDTKEFWEIMRKWSKNNKVFISEYTAPNDFICITEIQKTLGLRTKNSGNENRTEKLYTINLNPLFSL